MNNAKRPNVHTKSVHGKVARINSIHEKDQQPTRFYTHFQHKLTQANHAATSDSPLNDCIRLIVTALPTVVSLYSSTGDQAFYGILSRLEHSKMS